MKPHLLYVLDRAVTCDLAEATVEGGHAHTGALGESLNTKNGLKISMDEIQYS